MDITTRLLALLTSASAATGLYGPAGGIEGAPPAGPHDHIDGLHCVMRPHEICRLDGTRPVRDIVATHTAEQLPATREECLWDDVHHAPVCAQVPMQWPQIEPADDSATGGTAPGIECGQVDAVRWCQRVAQAGGER